MKKTIADKVQRRTRRLEARVSEEEYKEVARLADICGLSASDYLRKVALGQHPRQRLSRRELEALESLDDARKDIARIMGPVKNMLADERARMFNNPLFMEQMVRAAERLMKRWKEIMDYISR